MKKMIALDLETTGFVTPDQRIVEIYAGRWDTDTRELEEEYFVRINPERSIPTEAMRVHGITAAMVAGCDNFATIAPSLIKFLGKADVFLAHNGDGFDKPFLEMELKRVGQPTKVLDKPWIDSMLEGRFSTPEGKVPNLGELCFACDVRYDTSKAHAAAYDVEIMAECFFRGLDWGFFKLPELKELSVAA